jgi:nucleotide-binding universal stress UspA family protein
MEPSKHPTPSTLDIWRTILVPVDFSTPSEAALTYALKLAAASGAALHVCHIIPVPHVLDALYERGFEPEETVKRIEHKARQRMNEIVRSVSSTLKPHLHCIEGDARDGVLEWAEKLKADLIVMGTHGRQGAERFFMGSVAEAVVRRASCPVLTLRAEGPKSKV